MSDRRLTLKRAQEILNTPPTVLDWFWLEDREAWIEFKKVRYEYSGIELMKTRRHTIHGASEWETG
jgi:hypothetical protein